MITAIHPQAQQVINELIQGPDGSLSTYPFPDNIAALLPLQMRKDIMAWMQKSYIWPQVQERKQYEKQWEKLLNMVRASWKLEGKDYGTDENDTRLLRRRKQQAKVMDGEDPDSTISAKIDISDTVIFDAVDRLCNLNHFISFKEQLPVRYEIPDDMVFPHENEVYSPTSNLVRAANCWLKFNAQNQDVYREGWKTARHHYTYGCSFVCSEFNQRIELVPRRMPDKSFQNMLELTDVGVTFQPISIRKLWLDCRLPVYKMNYQPCPFFFEEMPRFAVIANQYDRDKNPFGFVNTENLPPAQYLFGATELESIFKVWSSEAGGNVNMASLMPPELSVELLWTLYPMLPLGMDPAEATPENPQGFVFDADGTKKIPMARWIVQMFGNNLCNGQQEIIRLQRNFYPKDEIPLYGSAHIPTLDDGAYGQAIGTLLENHYIQICKAIMQYLENKDWINDPAHTVMQMSPAMNKDLNQKGAKIPVLSQNDVASRPVYDGTQTTPQFLSLVREQAQTSSKAVDAILGKAMGSRTSATEATNAFQTAMSGVTTDINLFSYDIYGGYATRVWDYTGRWVDPDVLAAITGSYGFSIKPEHMALRLGLKWDIGSSFIESVTRQGNYRYLLESTQPGDPSINRPYLYKALLKEWKMKDVDQIINDGGMENQIQLATEQACQTYLGQMVLIDPDQDHNLAIKIKKSFLADRRSVWNTTPSYAVNGQKLVEQIQQHFLFVQMQMLQMQLQQQRMMLGAGDGMEPAEPLQPVQNQNNPSPGKPATTPGQQRQQTGQ
jgi:hypothetical protein